MRQMIKSFLWVVFLAFGLQAAWGFALLGPLPIYPGLPATFGDKWQVTPLGYDLIYLNLGVSGGGVWLGDIGGPKNYQEEYRRNVPVLYYAYDDNFSGVTGEGFFGKAGEDAVDQAFAIMNSLTNMDNIDLSLFPFQSQSFNFTAQGLYLTDLKSTTLHLLVEQLGLTEPERYTWTLHDRYTAPGPLPCPLLEYYLVVQRNFDPVPSPLNQVQYSPYVNNVLYTYFIEDDCDRHPPDWTAITVPRGEDPSAVIYTAVAANNYAGSWGSSIYIGGLQIGGFYTGLTRDDVGGLKYLMRTNNVNYESPAAGSILTGSTTIGVTNLSPPSLLYTSNYTAFAMAALTNDPVTLSNLFPGLVVSSSSYYFTNIATPIVVAYYTNLIGAPFGSPPMLVVKTNGYTHSFPAIYSYIFPIGNLVILPNGFHPNTSASLMTVTVGVQIGAPYGSPLVTNTTTKTVTLTNVPSGEYYINTNYLCGPPLFLSTLATNVTATTNFLFAASNSAGFLTSQSLVTYATTHVYVVQQRICSTTVTGGGTNSPGYYQGIGGVRFVRVPDGLMDPLTHILTTPITARYTNFLFNPVNRQLEARIFQRVVTTPDIILSAADLAQGPAVNPFVGTVTRPVPNYEIANILPGLAGPGVIDGQTIFTFNKVGPVFYNGPFPDTNGFRDLVNQTTQVPALQWASFDSSTNLPILYPNGTTIQELENQMAISISPTSLPDGANTVAYPTTTFSATGGTSPYTWSLETGTLPPSGLIFSSAGVLSGTPSGNSPGIYDFTIQVTDSLGRTVALNYTITIQ
jgi:hypothetical protein